MTPSHLTSDLLSTDIANHGFYGRAGGVSKGIFSSLNAGFGSNDHADDVAENRHRCAAHLGVNFERLLTVHQTHSPDVIVVDGPWTAAPLKADGMVTNTPNLAIGVLAADCMPWLFIDPEARIIGAAHAGWRGALGGVLENTVSKMSELGARENRIRACVGPCLRQANFEVGLDLVETFTQKFPQAEAYFGPGISPEKRQFDLASFGKWRLRESGLEAIDDVGKCTLAAPDEYFSYRATQRAGHPDYGRNLSAITLV